MPQHGSTDGFAEIAAKFNEDFAADSKRFAENAGKFKSDVEAGDTKLKAAVESLFQPNTKVPTKPNPTEGKWLLARKAWAWLNRE